MHGAAGLLLLPVPAEDGRAGDHDVDLLEVAPHLMTCRISSPARSPPSRSHIRLQGVRLQMTAAGRKHRPGAEETTVVGS